MGAARIFARRAIAVSLAGGLLLVVAFIFDASPLFVPAVALLAIGVLTPLWVWLAARGARTERRLTGERVVEEQPVEVTLEVRRGWFGLPGAEVVDPFTGSRFELSGELAPVRGERMVTLELVSRFHRRGLHRLPPPSLSLRDPLELARSRTLGPGRPQQLLVLPRTEPVRWLRAGHGRRLQLPAGRAGTEALAAVDVDGLRPYRPGTPASRIHWPAVARGAGLIERRLQADGDARPLIVLDARMPSPPGPGGPPELLDAAVRAAASLVLALARGGGCGLLLPGEARPTTIDLELIAWPAAYARLAVVTGGPGAPPPALGVSTARTGAMIYVAASPVDRLSAILTAPGASPTVLVVPEPLVVGGRPPGVRGPAQPTLVVSGCRGFLLGVGRAALGSRAPEEALP